MRLRKGLLLLTLLGSLVLAGCDSGGFSAIHKPNTTPPSKDDIDHGNNEQDDVGVKSGGSSAGFDKDKDESENNEGVTDQEIIAGSDTPEVVVTNPGDIITTFNFNFVETNADNYVMVTFNDDPLKEDYNFAYYTVNGAKVENQLLEKVENNNKKMFKINLNTVESGSYEIAFYNHKDVQYGVAYVTIEYPVKYTSFLSVAFGVAQMQIATIGYNISLELAKIGEFFAEIFTSGKLSMN